MEARKVMPTCAIEFHDSRLESIARTHGGVRIELLGYLHESDGRPGRDPGTGWEQRVEFDIPGATPVDLQLSLPATILDGELLVAGKATDELVAVPFELSGQAVLRLELEGAALEISGNSVSVHARGPLRFL
jgi:hypothetical protein